MSKSGSSNREHNRTHFYKYLGIDGAKAVLKNRALRWSSPILFNDPLDNPENLEFQFTNQELQDAIAIEFANRLEKPDESRDRKSGILKASQIMATALGEEYRKFIVSKMREYPPRPRGEGFIEFQEEWKRQVSQLRILCLSEVNDHVAMWNHYAGEYSGVVLKLECVEELNSALLVAQPVEYTEEAPHLTTIDAWVELILENDPDRLKELVMAARYYKTPHWENEKEWRVVNFAREDEQGLYRDYPFNEREISAVFLGPKISPDDEDEILGLLKGDLGHVAAYRSEFDILKRLITFEPINLANQ